jgi:hypothetical protein
VFEEGSFELLLVEKKRKVFSSFVEMALLGTCRIFLSSDASCLWSLTLFELDDLSSIAAA